MTAQDNCKPSPQKTLTKPPELYLGRAGQKTPFKGKIVSLSG